MDAVEILTGKELANWTPPPKKEEKNEPKVLRLPEKYQDSKRVIQYLFNRGIDYHIIQAVSYTHLDVYKRQAAMWIPVWIIC